MEVCSKVLRQRDQVTSSGNGVFSLHTIQWKHANHRCTLSKFNLRETVMERQPVMTVSACCLFSSKIGA